MSIKRDTTVIEILDVTIFRTSTGNIVAMHPSSGVAERCGLDGDFFWLILKQL